MTEDEKFYLGVALIAFETCEQSHLPKLVLLNPTRGFLHLFDSAYAMGFGAAKRMQSEGIDIAALNPEKLSLISPEEKLP